MPKLRPLVPWLISAAIIAAGLVHATRPPGTPAQACGITEDISASKPGAIEVSLWASAPRNECWRAFMAAVAAPLVTDYAIHAEPTALAMNAAPAFDLFMEAAAQGRAPDIVWEQDLRAAQKAGYIAPLDKCIQAHAEFQNINPKLWPASTWDGHTWAVPMDMSFIPLFFNKTLLRQMGWSQARVDALPEDIRAGRFTLVDLQATAKEAIRQGVVEPGFGLWLYHEKGLALLVFYHSNGGHTYDTESKRLILRRVALLNTFRFYRALFDEGIVPDFYKGERGPMWNRRVIQRDAVAAGRTLFWMETSSTWGLYAMNKVADRGGQDYLFEHVGYTLVPAARTGGLPNTHFNGAAFYALASDRATGGRNHEDQACALLAKMMTPEINDLYVASNANASVLMSPSKVMADSPARYGHDTAYMLDYAWNWQHPRSGEYMSIITEFAQQLESGDAMLEQLVEQTVERMRVTFGDELIVE